MSTMNVIKLTATNFLPLDTCPPPDRDAADVRLVTQSVTGAERKDGPFRVAHGCVNGV